LEYIGVSATDEHSVIYQRTISTLGKPNVDIHML